MCGGKGEGIQEATKRFCWK